MNPRARPYERHSRGYTPPGQSAFWRVMGGIVGWYVAIIALFCVAYPLVRWVVG